MGSATQIEQVLLNLLLNARDALSDIGDRQPAIDLSVDLIDSISAAEKDKEQNRSGPFVRLQIYDNGVGMDEETQSRIFAPFFTTKDVGLGTELGLSTVYGIVHQHSGWINCSSRPASGTSFSVYLPTADRQVEPPQVAVESPSPGGETILVIDDEEMIRHTVGSILEHYGHPVLVAEDGRKGLETFRRHSDQIALILLDLSMPHMSGQETLAHLRSIAPNVKVIIFTGHVAAASSAEFAGTERLEKPINSKGLIRKVRQVPGRALTNVLAAAPIVIILV
tara:strand:+ start:219 stop:1058 length:840 start_codon:yes stop_codon:yes gene_type:complete